MITNKDELMVITSAAILGSFKIIANADRDLNVAEMRDIIVDHVAAAILERGICIEKSKKKRIETCGSCRYEMSDCGQINKDRKSGFCGDWEEKDRPAPEHSLEKAVGSGRTKATGNRF